MEWNVVNAQNRDVERQHLNKILKEIRGAVDTAVSNIDALGGNFSQAQQQLTNTIVKIINNEVPIDRLVTSVTLQGDVTGTSVVVPGQNAVTITTELQGDFLSDAPNDANAYWRRAGQWEAVPAALFYLNEIDGSGYAVWDSSTLSWVTRSIESASADRIVITDGDGVDGTTTIDLAEVVPTSGGSILTLSFDEYGRRVEEDSATTDDLSEGSTNLYFPEAPTDGQLYGRQNSSWQPVTSGGGFVPFFIPTGQIFTVPTYQQALYSQEIILDGTAMIVLEGILIEVD